MDELMRWLRHWLRRPQAESAVPLATVNTPVLAPGFAMPGDIRDQEMARRSLNARRELDRMRDRRRRLSEELGRPIDDGRAEMREPRILGPASSPTHANISRMRSMEQKWLETLLEEKG